MKRHLCRFGGVRTDTITLGGGSDQFYFRDGEGYEMTTDFNAGARSDDFVELSTESSAKQICLEK